MSDIEAFLNNLDKSVSSHTLRSTFDRKLLFVGSEAKLPDFTGHVSEFSTH